MMLRIGNSVLFPKFRFGKTGFTLVEVLLAVSILAFGIVGVLGAYTTALSALGVAQENIDAIGLLKEKMAEIEQTALEEEGLSPGTSYGELKGFNWELEINSLDEEGLNEVILVVSREKNSRKFSLVTYAQDVQDKEE